MPSPPQRRGDFRGRIAAAIALEGSGTTAVVTRALGSLRFRVTVTGPGGHSWSDAGTPNPIVLLSRALTAIDSLPLPTDPLTTMNVGHISGGTSVNSIPSSATALVEVRSTDSRALEAAAVPGGPGRVVFVHVPRIAATSPRRDGSKRAKFTLNELVRVGEAILGAVARR